jgi:tetratricopeptide (TPR) repeat protein
VLARAAAQGAVDAWRRLVKLYPQQPRNRAGLADALLQLGDVQFIDKLDATATLREAVRAHEALVNAAPKDFDRGFALARSLTRWADALAARGRKAEARAALAQATERFRLTEPLAPSGKRPAWQSARERARRLLGQLSQ